MYLVNIYIKFNDFLFFFGYIDYFYQNMEFFIDMVE